jgi:hypothetical protein
MANATTPVIQINEGNVGINTTTPTTKLHVHNTSSNSQLTIERTGTAPGKYGFYTNTGNLFINNVTGGASTIPMIILNNGNVGIGAGNPSSKLTIDGGFNYPTVRWFSSNNTTRYMQVGMITPTEHSIRAYGSSTELTFWTGSSFSMVINSSGNVGIKTTTVQANTSLDVRGDGSASDAAIKAYAYGESGTAILGQGYATSGVGINYGVRGLSTGPRSTVAGSVNVGGYFSASNAETNYALITGAGNVGIGTNSPDGKLHVEDTILHSGTPPPILTLEQQYPEIIIKDIGTYVSIDTYYRNSSDITVANYSINSNPGYIGIRTTFDSGGTGGTLFVQGQNEFSWSINNTSEVMRVHTNGNVGIGITAPGQKLDVDGTIRGTAFRVGNSTSTYLSVSSYSNQPYINTGTTGGTVNFGAPATNTTNVYVQGTITANADVVAYSDERLKSNIKTLDGSKVYEMRGVSFDKDGKKSSGVIAQEMEKVAPELVNEESEYLGVAYGNISGYLIEAIKELKAEIDLLKSKPCTCNKCNCNI